MGGHRKTCLSTVKLDLFRIDTVSVDVNTKTQIRVHDVQADLREILAVIHEKCVYCISEQQLR